MIANSQLTLIISPLESGPSKTADPQFPWIDGYWMAYYSLQSLLLKFNPIQQTRDVKQKVVWAVENDEP